jgi:hypothetical protein
MNGAGRWAVLLLAAACSAPALCPGAPPKLAEPHLLHPATLGGERQVQQVVRAAFGARESVLQCVVTVHAEGLAVVCLTAAGLRAFSVSWDGDEWSVQTAPMLPGQWRPQALVADLQLALWPLPALQSVYSDSGWTVTEPGGGVRRLRHGGELVAEVHYADQDPWGGRFWLANFRHGYALAVESQPLTGH